MTDFSSISGAPASHSFSTLQALAADLSAMDITVDGVADLLGADASSALSRDQTVPALIALRGDHSSLATVLKLWVLADEVPSQEVANALPSLSLNELIELGLIELTQDQRTVRASIDLRPYGWPATDSTGAVDLWVASDLGAHQRPGVLRHDHVLGIGQASLTLAQGTMRKQVARALDLGTGCGIQLFHLLQHAKTVVATDISERALAFTRFNLLLNAKALGLEEFDVVAGLPADLTAGDPRVSLRLGSLLEPVAGEEFDLVVSNPPFVITPRHRGENSEDQFTYRDGGLAGDAIVEQLVSGLPSILAPGGVAQMLGNWEITGEQWQARPESWVAAETGAWFIQREQVSPAGYAETWLQDASQGRDPQAYAAAYEDYLEDFASRNVVGVGFGYIMLLKGSGKAPLRRFEEILYPIEAPIAPAFAATLERIAWLEANPTIANAYLDSASDVTEERHQRPGAEHPGVILLRQGAGLRRTNLLSTELAGFVSASDGELSVGQIIGALATLLERDDAEFAEALTEEVRNLVRDGFLLPASDVN